MAHLISIKNKFYYKRRIPKNLAGLYGKKEFIQVTLKTSDKGTALQRAAILDNEVEAIWADLQNGGDSDKDLELRKVISLAQAYQFQYKQVSELALAPIHEIVNRVSAVNISSTPDKDKVLALLGGIDKDKRSISTYWSEYLSFCSTNLKGKSDHQRRKWANPRKKALNNFVLVCGDLAAEEISREHILNFRSWWAERIEQQQLTANSANKDFIHFKSYLAYIQDNHCPSINVDGLFSRIHFREQESVRRPFQTDFIQSTLLNLENLDGLHEECKWFLFAMADSGARPSELVGLNPKNGDIRLDTEIPYIHIRPEADKEIKTRYSERQIPLVGTSLYGFQRLNEGFARYYRKPDQLSANLNKFLREHDLFPSENHTVYSLRHSFEDRLTAVEPPDKVQAALMGHKYERPRYGDGPSLDQKRKWLKKIELTIL